MQSQHPLLFFALAFSLVQFSVSDNNPHEAADAALARGLDLLVGGHSSEDLSRFARASPLRWGKRTTGQNNILRWGKREADEANTDEVEETEQRLPVLLNRPVREAPLRWGKRLIGLDESEGLEMRHLRASPLRWGKRSFLDDKRAPLRWGKRTPNRFGKREFDDENSESHFDSDHFY